MNNEINDGGPAFPRPPTPAIFVDEGTAHCRRVQDESEGSPGMTLLDYFAGKALANFNICDAHGSGFAAKNAEYAYMSAEAMLAERQKRKERKP